MNRRSGLPADFLAPTPAQRLDVLSADGTRIAVQVHGPQTAPTVVLAHGWTCSAGFWGRVVNRLGDRVRAVTYDQRGHGRSGPAGPAGYTVDALAEDLAAVLTACVPQGERAVHVGHSMGAMALLSLAERDPALLTERVGAALLASTGVGRLVDDARLVPVPGPLRRVRARLTGLGLREPFLLKALPRAGARVAIAHITLSRGASAAERAYCTDVVRACPSPVHAGFARMLARIDLAAGLRALDVPTLVLCGTADRLTPIGHSRRMAAALPQLVDLVELPGAGHMTPVQCPDEVAAAVLRLVRPVPGSPTSEGSAGRSGVTMH